MNKNPLTKKNKVPLTAPAKSVSDKKGNILTDHIKGKEVYLTVLLISIVAFFVFKDFLLQNKVFLYKDIGSDTLNAYYPFLFHTTDYIQHWGLPSWSFNFGMGQNIFPFFIRGPFDLLLFLIGKDSVASGLGYIEFLKVITGGLLFFLYLRTLGMKSFACITGSLIFSFSGFMIVGGGWYIFSYEALTVALLLLAFEKLYQHHSWFLFTLTIALMAITMTFNLYIYGLFLLVYAALRYFEDHEIFQLNSFAALYGRMIMFGLLGLALSSFFLFPNILQMLESPRGSGDFSYFEKLFSTPLFKIGNLQQNLTSVFRLFSSDLLGTGSDFKGSLNYLEAPMFYSGLLSILLFPQVFPFLSTRKKVLYAIFFLIWLLPVIFPFFRYAIWLFTGDYFRGFSFIISLLLMYFAIRALNYIDHFSKVNFLVLAITISALLIVLSYPYFKEMNINPLDKKLMGFVKVMLVLYTLLICGLAIKNIKQYAQLLLLLILCIELGYLSNISVNKRSILTTKEYEQKEGYHDYTLEAVDFLKKRDSGFYRVDKNYGSAPSVNYSLNDGLVQDYYGTSSYMSFNQMNYIYFLQTFNIIKKDQEAESRWAEGLRIREVLENICSVKYFFKRDDINPVFKTSFVPIARFGNVNVLESKNYLPMGITYDKYITRSEFDKLSDTQKDYSMLKAFLTRDDEKEYYSAFTKFDLKDTLPTNAYTPDTIQSYITELRRDTFHISSHGQTFFNGTVDLSKSKLLFFSIPFDKGWIAIVDGVKKELKIVDGGLTGLLLDKGKHQIALSFQPRLRNVGMIISLLSVILLGFLIWHEKKLKRTILP